MENISTADFSVAMSVYGGDDPDYFSEAMASVIKQSVPPPEIVLVVDGPIPVSIQKVIDNWLSKYGPLIKPIYLAENRGLGEARRIALENCTFDLVALMDSDDISTWDRFEKQLLYFQRNEGVSVVGGLISEFIGSPENSVGVRTVELEDENIKIQMKSRCPMNHITVMLRKKDVAAAGGYLDWYCNEDYYLWARLMKAGYRFANIPEVLAHVRVGEDMYRRRGGPRYFSSEARLQIYLKKERIISLPRMVYNIGIRFALQVLFPNRLRGLVYRRFARQENADGRG